MILYSQPELSAPAPCPYLPDRTLVYSFFFADGLNSIELSWFLSRGWRKFGHYFFRPACPDCRACTPLRVPVRRFLPSRGQKRVLRRCSHLRVSFGPVRYEKELFDLYHTHSQVRFGQESSFDEFIVPLVLVIRQLDILATQGLKNGFFNLLMLFLINRLWFIQNSMMRIWLWLWLLKELPII